MLSFNTKCIVNKPRWSLNVIKEKRAARIARMSFCGFPHFELSKLTSAQVVKHAGFTFLGVFRKIAKRGY